MLSIVAIGGATIPPLFTRIASTWGFDAAWQFQGVVSMGFALLALLARSKRTVDLGVARAAKPG